MAKTRGQAAGFDKIDANTQKSLQIRLQATQIEERCARERVDQNIEIAIVIVIAARADPNTRGFVTR